eukprot:752197-Hanusia_phi.AAC.1
MSTLVPPDVLQHPFKVPRTRAEALKSGERDFWLEAERKELVSIQEKKVWEVVDYPGRRDSL